jgi:signal transduction histidine kinase
MAEQTINFQNGQRHPHKFRVSGLNSLSRQIPMETSLDEVPGADWHGMGGQADQRAEKQLHNARSKLNMSKLNILSRFTREAELSASIVHQFNNALTSMLANAQAAKHWLAAEPPNLMEATASIDRIVRDARGADETTRRIRAIFKQEPFDREESNLTAIMSDAVRLLLEGTDKRKVPIEWHCCENLPKIYVDPVAIQVVLINLISNAIAALENTKSPLIVLVAAVTNLPEILVQVIDNGPGIGDSEEIFEAFVTTKENGLGIGLALSRLIAEAHGGRLWAENNLNGGVRFCLALPLGSKNRILAGA